MCILCFCFCAGGILTGSVNHDNAGNYFALMAKWSKAGVEDSKTVLHNQLRKLPPPKPSSLSVPTNTAG